MNRTAVRIVIYAGTAAGVFWLPFQIPLWRAMPSISQAFHFNNQVAIAALLTGVALATWWSWREARPAPFRESSPSDSALDLLPADRQLGWWPLFVALFVSGGELTLVCLASGWFPVDEAAYFVNRLFLMQDGRIPYRDFEFAYGPAMLYVPVALRRLAGLSVPAAYFSALWIFAWGGLFLLWWVVRQARTRPEGKTVAFLLLAALPAVNPESGIQYTMLRFICAFAALVAARIVAEKLATRWFLVAICHWLLVGVVFSISPEIGFAFLAGLGGYWFLEYQAGSKWLAYSGALCLGLLAGLAIITPRAAFASTESFLAGGNSLPLFPSPYMLLYVGSLLIVVGPLLAIAIQAALEGRQGFGIFGMLTGPFAVLAIAMIPAALSRGDAGHVFFNGLGVFLLALLAPSKRKPPSDSPASPVFRRWLYPTAFFLIFPVLSVALNRISMLSTWTHLALARAVEWSEQHSSSLLARGARRTLSPEEWNRLRGDLEDIRQASLENFFPNLSRYGKVCAPLARPDVNFALARHNLLQAEYYYGLFNVFTPPAVHHKIDDLRSCDYAILPEAALVSVPQSPRLNIKLYRRILMFPIWEPQAVAPMPVEVLDCARTSFVPVQRVVQDLYLCEKRPAGP